METLKNEKFNCLSNEEMMAIEGGRWHVECRLCRDGSSHLAAYRTNIFGNIVEWGDTSTD
jgi:hypothetical protein